jgi:hypothetical protein
MKKDTGRAHEDIKKLQDMGYPVDPGLQHLVE